MNGPKYGRWGGLASKYKECPVYDCIKGFVLAAVIAIKDANKLIFLLLLPLITNLLGNRVR